MIRDEIAAFKKLEELEANMKALEARVQALESAAEEAALSEEDGGE